MGMYDNIIDVPPVTCIECGEDVNEWQSKDGECMMHDVPFHQVDTFYGYCKCGARYTYKRMQPKPPVPLHHYIMKIVLPEPKESK